LKEIGHGLVEVLYYVSIYLDGLTEPMIHLKPQARQPVSRMRFEPAAS
jgi:hypothetical protein